MSDQIIGGAEIHVFADVDDAVRKLEQLQSKFNQLARQKPLGQKFFGEAEQQIQSIERAIARIQDRLTRPVKGFDLVPQVDKTDAVMQRYLATLSRAAAENEKFDQKLSEQLRLFDAGVPVIDKATRSIQNYGAVQARATKENEKLDANLRHQQTLFATGVPVVDKTSRAVQTYGATIARATTQNEKFDAELRHQQALLASGVPVIDKTTRAVQAYGNIQARAIKENEQFGVPAKQAATGLDAFIGKLQTSGGAVGALGKGLASVTGLFARFGLTARDVGIALGAGFLTTGAAIVLLLGVKLVGAISNAIVSMAKLGSELIQLRQVTERAVGGASQAIDNFAQNAATEFGITETAALRFVNRTARLFQSFGTVTKEASANLGAGLVQVAEILRVTSGTGLTMDDALARIFNTISGNIEGLREFNIFMTEISLKQLAAAHGIEITNETLDAQERTLLSTIAAYDAARKAVDDYFSTNASVDQQIEGLKAQIKSLTAELGTNFAPIFRTVLEITKDFLEASNRVFEGLKVLVEKVRNFDEANNALAKALRAVVKAVAPYVQTFTIIGDLLDFLNGKEDENKKKTEEKAAAVEKLTNDTQALIDAYHEQNRAEGRSAEGLQKLIDLEEKAAEARREATKSIEDASIAFARAREDAARDVVEANRDIDEAIREQSQKNADALDAVREAEEDAEQAIFEARDRLGEAKLKRDRAIRDAEEKLAKARLESARKVDDAERQLADARRKRNEEIVDAQLDLDAALAQGDANAERKARLDLSRAQNSKAVAGAERDLREEELERLEKIKEAERDLKETRIDSNDAVADAQRALDKVIAESQEKIDDAMEKLRRTRRDTAREVEEAQRRLHDIEVANNRTLFDAQRRLNEATIEGNQRIKETQEEVDILRRKYDLVTESVGELRRMLRRVLRIQRRLSGRLDPITDSNASGTIPVLAHGGPARGGFPHFVGEKGVELFIPDQSGTVISNDRLIKALREMFKGSGRGGNSFTVVEAVSAEATARAIEARLAQGVNN